MVRRAIANTIRRLNLHGVIMKLPIFGQAIYDGLSLEFERVNAFRNLVKSATVVSKGIDHSTITDLENKYGITPISTDDNDNRICRILGKSARDGNGADEWLQQQIQSAGFDLYVHINERDVSNIPQYGDFQYGDVQYGGSVFYTDPRTIPGELVASSPNGNIGAQYLNYGDFQYGDVQYGTLAENTANPRPLEFSITSDPNRWGYIFFISPFPHRLAINETEFLQINSEEWGYLKRLIIQLKHLRNWAIVQVEIID